ncbi:hypothetical protein PENPOL_c003G00481 [Penicillium polonicum]|uniref:Uncharacterized protein n=1 Tax=Penicillium polonicum TaxID=60169 RepID=A0A1V6NSX6_PENPO|nr:hypothetical protein PENPOL_c003G00481 [Penicillium polonicum]
METHEDTTAWTIRTTEYPSSVG